MDSIIHRLFLASLSHIVSARFVTFVYQWWRVRSARGCLYISESNVEVHLRRTLCDVRWNVLLAPIIHRLFPASAQNRFRAVVAVRIAPVEGPLVVQSPYILSQRQRSPSVHLVHRRGGTPCWDFHFGCSCPGPVRNRGRAVDALCGRVVEDPFHVR